MAQYTLTPNLPNRRGLKDANQVLTTAYSAANSSVNSASLDLTQSYSLSELLAVQVDTDAMPNFTSNINTATYYLQHSADNSNWANIPELGPITQNGVASTGVASSLTTFGGIDQWKLPPATKQYVRGVAALTAGAGANTSANFYISLVF